MYATIGGKRVPVISVERRAGVTRYRLARPSDFDRRSFRTVALSGGRKLVIGCPLGAWDARGQFCRVGTRAQALVRPRKKRK